MPTLPAELYCLWLAMLLDMGLRELPNRLHPVAWMGAVIGAFRARAPRRGRGAPLLAGAVLVLAGAAVVGTIGFALQAAVRQLPAPLSWLTEALLLKCTFAASALARAGKEVKTALELGDLPAARDRLSWHLVSRETATLDESQVAAATIESIAENTSDSVVAPLLYYCLAGLPGALAYRFINTCDAMLGYRDAEREWLGKVPARLDDLVNLLPARMTAVLIMIAGLVLSNAPLRAAGVWFRDRRTTASPNAGHPMSAAAGVLGVELEKLDHYRLGQGQPPPVSDDIGRATCLLWGALWLSVLLLSVLLVLW